jgi:integration host factor subunit alpha
MDTLPENIDSSTLTKAQLAELLFDKVGLSKRESKDDVKISSFGNFQIRTKAPRPGRNPRTGEAIPIKARRVVTFHASLKLKEQLQPIAPPVPPL